MCVRDGKAGTLTSSVTGTIRRLDSAVPVYDVYTLERQINDSGGGFGGVKGAAMVTGVLGLLALTLALVGTHGVLSFTVKAPEPPTRRTRASSAIATGAQSVDEIAQHRLPPGATQHVAPSFFMQKSMDLRQK
jgi:hypothetical protein